MRIHSSPSPNFNDRPVGVGPSLIVVHGTGGTGESARDWLMRKESGVSYHYLIMEDGRIHRMVQEDKRAWHAGVSEWDGVGNCNDYSIGIGLAGREGEPFTVAQYASFGSLAGDILHRRKIPMRRIVGHYHVSPGRKTDPWYSFEWGEALEYVSRTVCYLDHGCAA